SDPYAPPDPHAAPRDPPGAWSPPPLAGPPPAPPAVAPTGATAPATTPIYSPFGGTVEVVALKVREGEAVVAGQVVAAVEAMKAQHDVRTPVAGTVARVHVRLGDEVRAGEPIVSIATTGG
ncbi:MAG: biotin/lipoyl-binding protein, partial [Trueperaceae bacterium]|nr:biotin/lipoyl-binding protein [Trueperaceae bacterium]